MLHSTFRKLITLLTLLGLVSFASSAQETSEPKLKWDLLPSASYSSDLGLQYGIFGDFYFFGPKSHYPTPRHQINWEMAHSTKGRTRAYAAYDSGFLLPTLRFTSSVAYVNDPLFAFYGFNGTATNYDSSMNMNKATSTSYYNMNRQMFRALLDAHQTVAKDFSCIAGLAFWKFKTGSFAERYGYDTDNTLYNDYLSSGLLGSGEANGGSHLEFRLGLNYDSRDFAPAPEKGIWAEIFLSGSPDFFKNSRSTSDPTRFDYLKLSAHFRQYVSIPIGIFSAGDPVFAYHLGLQTKLAGEMPFYMLQNIDAIVLKQMLSEGLGSFNTIRGTYSNRVLADGYAWGNFELRIKLLKLNFLKQDFYLATNPFFDCGMIAKSFRKEALSTFAVVNDDNWKKPFCTTGIGFKVGWNENFILSIEAAHAFNSNIGDPFWFYVGTNYTF